MKIENALGLLERRRRNSFDADRTPAAPAAVPAARGMHLDAEPLHQPALGRATARAQHEAAASQAFHGTAGQTTTFVAIRGLFDVFGQVQVSRVHRVTPIHLAFPEDQVYIDW